MRLGFEVNVPPREFLGFCERPDDYMRAIDGGTETFGFTSGEFSLIDILAAAVRKMPRARVVISTWTAAGAEMNHVKEFLGSGAIDGSRWIVDRSFQNRQPELCAELRAQFGDDCIRVQRVHCKFMMLDNGARQVVIQTSANLNKNTRIENISVSTCPVFFGAYAGLVEDIFGTQIPGAGFEESAVVTQSFKAVAKKKTKKKTIANPWLKSI